MRSNLFLFVTLASIKLMHYIPSNQGLNTLLVRRNSALIANRTQPDVSLSRHLFPLLLADTYALAVEPLVTFVTHEDKPTVEIIFL